MWIRSAEIRPMMVFEAESITIRGLRVLGSECCENTSVPPFRPISPARIKKSEEAEKYDEDWWLESALARECKIVALHKSNKQAVYTDAAISAIERTFTLVSKLNRIQFFRKEKI